jgi:hypothetical protein
MSDDNSEEREGKGLLHQRVVVSRRLSTMLIILSLASLVSISPKTFPSTHATGFVYVNPPMTAVASVGTVVTVRVQVASVDPFDGWDIQVQSNQSVIDPTSLSIQGNTLAVNYSENVLETVNCVNGVSHPTSHCDRSDGPGIVHSAAMSQEGSPTYPVYGVLFTINYTVAGSGSYSPLEIQKAIMTNGPDLIFVTTRDGIYGIPPGEGFMLRAFPASLSIFLGSRANVTLNVSSLGGYAAEVDLALETPHPGLLVSFNVTSTTLWPNHPRNVTMTIATDSTYEASYYTITVMATSNGLSHTATVSISTTDKPDFAISASPSILRIHATNSSSSIISLDTQSGFLGPVWLSLTVPEVLGLTASLGASELMISPGSSAATVLDIRTPDSTLPFVYLVNITATSRLSSHELTIIVTPPSPDFRFLLTGLGFVIQQGQSRTFTLTMTSIDYFKGQVNLSASSLLGAEEVFSPPFVALDFGISSASTMTLATDVTSGLGNHNVTLTALGTSVFGANVTHVLVMIVTVTQLPSRTILGLQPLIYFGTIGALCLVAIVAAVRGVRKLKH